MKTKKQWGMAETGAQREALDLYYFRQVPLEAVSAGAAAFEYGAEKYANRNWEKGLPWQQMIDSLRRHLDDFERQKEFDNEEGGSNLPQVCMIMASAMMLTTSVLRNIGTDNRLPPPGKKALSAKECAKMISLMMQESRLKNANTDQDIETAIIDQIRKTSKGIQ